MLMTFKLTAEITATGSLKLGSRIDSIIEIVQKMAQLQALLVAGDRLAQHLQEMALEKIDFFSNEEIQTISCLVHQWKSAASIYDC